MPESVGQEISLYRVCSILDGVISVTHESYLLRIFISIPQILRISEIIPCVSFVYTIKISVKGKLAADTENQSRNIPLSPIRSRTSTIRRERMFPRSGPCLESILGLQLSLNSKYIPCETDPSSLFPTDKVSAYKEHRVH